MRHYLSVKAISCLPLLFAAGAWAQAPVDRLAITRTIAALNEQPMRGDLFTKDGVGATELSPLFKGKSVLLVPLVITATAGSTDRPTVTISHEPWGEASINMPMPGVTTTTVLNPHIECGTIRFITADVALVDGVFAYKEGISVSSDPKEAIAVERTPLLFVMKKEGDIWKIDSSKVLSK